MQALHALNPEVAASILGESMITLRVFNTPIKIKLIVLANIIILWAATTWIGLYLQPDRDLFQGIVIGFFAMILLMIADIGHAISHIFSARHGGASMDEIRITSGMPRTIYADNDIPPSAHVMRSLGGPVFSLIGLLLSLIAFGLASNVPIARELAAWSMVGHGFILGGSLLPIPIVDGGVILKWTLVNRGKTESEADHRLSQVNWVIGTLGIAAGLVLIALQLWIAGLVSAGIGVISIAVAMGRIR